MFGPERAPGGACRDGSWGRAVRDDFALIEVDVPNERDMPRSNM